MRSSIRKQLQEATPRHMLIGVMSGFVFVVLAVWLHDRRDWTMPVFGIVATLISLGAAFLAPLLVTLHFSAKEKRHDEYS